MTKHKPFDISYQRADKPYVEIRYPDVTVTYWLREKPIIPEILWKTVANWTDGGPSGNSTTKLTKQFA